MGRIGRAIARRGTLGFGMKVVYHSSRIGPAAEAEVGARCVDKDTLRDSDHLEGRPPTALNPEVLGCHRAGGRRAVVL